MPEGRARSNKQQFLPNSLEWYNALSAAAYASIKLRFPSQNATPILHETPYIPDMNSPATSLHTPLAFSIIFALDMLLI